LSWTEKLLIWYYQNKRSLPWRKTKNPYFIWISEIILQQTTVKQGIPYYKKFINKYPNMILLAKSKEENVLKLWQGLGYYGRARNLHFTSKFILKNHKGVFPSSYDELIKLKGIGDYTASAIGSIAFKLPLAAIDGNVYRFFSRFFGIKKSIDENKSLKYFKDKSEELMDKKKPGDYNQALMEFGSLICRPRNPYCEICIFKKKCFAFNNNKIYDFPVRKKNNNKKIKRFLNYLIIKKENKEIIIEKRIKNDIWKNLYQFPLFETKSENNSIKKINHIVFKYNNLEKNKIKKWNIEPIKSKLSHQELFVTFWLINLKKGYMNKSNFIKLKKYPMPVVLNNFIDKFFKLKS
tara:strand:+ start:96460 stop:97509 length:1050 start_codon:yes stop_codon:yes gene_type:complete